MDEPMHNKPDCPTETLIKSTLCNQCIKCSPIEMNHCPIVYGFILGWIEKDYHSDSMRSGT